MAGVISGRKGKFIPVFASISFDIA